MIILNGCTYNVTASAVCLMSPSLDKVHLYRFGSCFLFEGKLCRCIIKCDRAQTYVVIRVLLSIAGFSEAEQNVRQTCISSCQMDHWQSDRDQDAQNRQSESHEAGAGPLPA